MQSAWNNVEIKFNVFLQNNTQGDGGERGLSCGGIEWIWSLKCMGLKRAEQSRSEVEKWSWSSDHFYELPVLLWLCVMENDWDALSFGPVAGCCIGRPCKGGNKTTISKYSVAYYFKTPAFRFCCRFSLQGTTNKSVLQDFSNLFMTSWKLSSCTSVFGACSFFFLMPPFICKKPWFFQLVQI